MAEHNQQFDTFDEWVNKGSSWLTRGYRYDSNGCPINRAVCFDAKGRLVECGGDFMRARDEGAFPVRWLWPDQIAEIGNDHPFFRKPSPDPVEDPASDQLDLEKDALARIMP